MYISQDFGRKKLRLIRDPSEKDINVIQHIYDEFYPNNVIKVYKSMYPISFINHLFKSNNRITYKYGEIESKYIKWLSYNTFINIKNIISTTAKSFYTSKINKTIEIIESESESESELESETENTTIKTPEYDISYNMINEPPLKIQRVDENIENTDNIENDEELIKVQSESKFIISEKTYTDETMPLASAPKKIVDSIFENIQKELLNLDVINNQYTGPLAYNDYYNDNNNNNYNNIYKKHFNIANFSTIKNNNNKMNDISHIDNTIVILFYNNLTSLHHIGFFSQDLDLNCLKHLSEYTDNDIDIKNITFLPSSEITSDLFKYYNCNNYTDNINNYLLNIYKVQKFSNNNNKNIPGAYVKTIIEFIYSTYDISFDNSLSVEAFNTSFEIFNMSKFHMQLNILISDEHIRDTIERLGFTVLNNQILFLKPKTSRININLNIDHKISQLISYPDKNKSYDLRGLLPIDDNMLSHANTTIY
jgi:hypothetical protein